MSRQKFDSLSLHKDPAYIRGRQQLAAWHEICREKRLGLPKARIKLEDKARRMCFNWCNTNGSFGDMQMGNIKI